MRHTLGAHLSTAGGFHKALERAKEIGADSLQIFSTSPRGWRAKKVTDEEVDKFKKLRKELSVDPVYFHASYLVNLADPGETGRKSIQALKTEFETAKLLDVRGSIIHIGSFKNKDDGEVPEEDYKILIENIKEVLKETPKEALFIAENSGTRKIGRRIEELSKIIRSVKSSRVRVCLDTCHLHAAGYDLSTQKKFDEFIKWFDEIIGLDRLELIHVNDSRDPLGSLRDRHENIGEGEIPKGVFKLFLNHPKTRHLPFIIETPGFSGDGPDKENLDRLKKMIQTSS